MSRFGISVVSNTDRGKQFEFEMFTHALMKLLGSRKIKTTAYYPEINGQVISKVNQSSLAEHRPLVLLGVRTTKKISSAHLHNTQTPWADFSSNLLKTFEHDLICGSTYSKDGEFGI